MYNVCENSELRSFRPRSVSPQLKVVTPQLEVVSPQLKVVSPQLEVVSPQVKVVSPRPKVSSPEVFSYDLGPFDMSPVTGLTRLPGRILLSVHMGNFSPVDRDEIQETKPTW